MKKCTKCKIEKSLSNFNIRKTSTDGLQSQCRDCQKSNYRNHYANNVEYWQNKRKNQRKRFQEWYDGILSQLECFKCGESHPALLDWHHEFPDNKIKGISILKKKISKRILIKEMKKCIILCANCHRMYHYNERNSEEVSHNGIGAGC